MLIFPLYKGIQIQCNCDGYYAEHGSVSFGYHEDIRDIKNEIDDYWAGDEHGELNGIFPS